MLAVSVLLLWGVLLKWGCSFKSLGLRRWCIFGCPPVRSRWVLRVESGLRSRPLGSCWGGLPILHGIGFVLAFWVRLYWYLSPWFCWYSLLGHRLALGPLPCLIVSNRFGVYRSGMLWQSNIGLLLSSITHRLQIRVLYSLWAILRLPYLGGVPCSWPK